MRVEVTNAVYYDTGNAWFYCEAMIVAMDPATNSPIPGITIEGTWSVAPDIDWYTDWYSEMPYTVAGNLGIYTEGYTYSPWIPLAANLTNWYPDVFPGGHPGTQCNFTVTSLTHPAYYVDDTTSTMTAVSEVL